MTFKKLLLLSICGLFTPIVLVVFFAKFFFENEPPLLVDLNSEPSLTSTNKLLSDPDSLQEGDLSSVSQEGSLASSIPSDNYLDPQQKIPFLVYIDTDISNFQKVGLKQKLISKHQKNSKHPLGWAISLRKLPREVRPEVYWSGNKTDGGWYTFDSFSSPVNSNVKLLLVVIPEKYMGMYFYSKSIKQESDPTKNIIKSPLENFDSTVIDKNSQDLDKITFKYLGGFDISKDGLPSTNDNIGLWLRNKNKTGYNAEINNLLILSPKQFPDDIEQIRNLIFLDSEKFIGSFSEDEINLNISFKRDGSSISSEQVEDKSRFKRQIQVR